MKYICVTEIDSVTGVVCTQAAMSNGPKMPKIKGLHLDWADKSTWPVEHDQTGKYLRAPKYFGVCADDANLNVPGVLAELTAVEWLNLKHDEFYARKPYESWIWNSFNFTWNSPVAYPEGAEPWEYVWNEDTTSWELVNE